MRVYIRHDKVHPSSSPSICIPVQMPIRPSIPFPYEYVPAIAQFFKSFIHLALYKGRGTASAGAEVDKCVLGDGRAKDALERAGDEGGGRCRLEDRGSVSPEKSEACLDEGAEGSGEPRIEF